MIIIQLLFLPFLFFALSRVILRFKGKQIKITEFGFWTLLFLTAIVVIIFPNETTTFAQLLGIGRGVDLVVYASIIALFYLVFRSYIMIEDLKHEITLLVRKLALEKSKKK